MRNYTLLLASLAASTAFSASLTPPITETGGLNTAFRNAPRTYLSYINESLLPSDGPQLKITGIRFRLLAASVSSAANPPADWPSQTLDFDNFEIIVGKANAQLTSDGEFIVPAENPPFHTWLESGYVNARSGGLTLSAADFPFDPSSTPTNPNPWSTTIQFDNAWIYTPGENLVYGIAHSGYNPTSEFQPFFANGTYANGYADAIASTVGGSFDLSPNGYSSPYVVQFEYEAVPEPATMTLLGLGALAALRKKRKA